MLNNCLSLLREANPCFAVLSHPAIVNKHSVKLHRVLAELTELTNLLTRRAVFLRKK